MSEKTIVKFTTLQDESGICVMEFTVNGEPFFIDFDQSRWKGIRMGNYPKKYDKNHFELIPWDREDVGEMTFPRENKTRLPDNERD